MGSLWHDMQYGCRVLAKSPGFAAVAVATLALGNRANAAVFRQPVRDEDANQPISDVKTTDALRYE